MVSLTKGQAISLEKTAGKVLTQVVMGLGWDERTQKRGILGKILGRKSQGIDLDASCIMYDAAGEAIDAIWFRQLRSMDGSVVHTGDNRTGAGDGDDEQIIVDLSRVPVAVTTLVFVVNSFTGETFDMIENAFCRLVDRSTGKEIARYDLTGSGSHTAQIMSKVFRKDQGWTMQAIGEIGRGRTFADLLPIIRPHLA